MSAFANFCAINRDAVRARNPHASAGEVGRVLAEAWNTLSTAQKRTYGPIAKRPLSAFMYFSMRNRDAIKAQYPGVGFAQLGKLVGQAWHNLTPAQKRQYEEMALNPNTN